MGKTKRNRLSPQDQDEIENGSGVMFRLECKVIDPGPNRVLPPEVILEEWFTIIRHPDQHWLETQERSMFAEDMQASARTKYRIVPCLSRKARARIADYDAREDAEDAAVFAMLAREQSGVL